MDGYEVLIAQAPGFDVEFYHQFGKNLTLIKNDMYGLLSQCEAALVTSGTATLETALMGVPQVVCYKTSKLSYEIVKYLIKVKYISLVNLIMNKEVVKELIQDDFNEKNLEKELHKILNLKNRQAIFLDYFELEKKLGGKGASKKVAELIIK